MKVNLYHYISLEQAYSGSPEFLVYQVREVSLVIRNNPTLFIQANRIDTNMELVVLLF